MILKRYILYFTLLHIMLVDCIYYQILYNFLIFKIKKISTIYNKRIYNAMKFFFINLVLKL